jgi:hypothetical protein
MTQEHDLIKVQNMFGDIFNVYYDPEHLCWIQEGTSFYYDIDDWAEGVIKKID